MALVSTVLWLRVLHISLTEPKLKIVLMPRNIRMLIPYFKTIIIVVLSGAYYYLNTEMITIKTNLTSESGLNNIVRIIRNSLVLYHFTIDYDL